MSGPDAPEVGKTYVVRHSRKGTFTARVKAVHGDFATLEIVSGTARAMLAYNERGVGEEVDVRLSLATFSNT